MTVIANQDALYQFITETVHNQEVTDIHTHLYPAEFEELLLWNVDELLTYHYLVAEVMRWSDISPEVFWQWNANGILAAIKTIICRLSELFSRP